MERTTPGINDDPVAASYQFPKTQYPANKMEEIPSTSSVLPMNLPPSSERKSVVFRPCRVCGDVAKSYHFGGLCCDSCKTFFLESVDRNNYFQFRCFLHGQCIVTVESRANCQYCRMKRCFEIGMQKSWVVTEEERKMLMKARAEKKVSKKFASPTATVEEFVDSNIDYEPQIERMTDFLAPLEIKEIESIVTKYIHAYQHVPCRTELRSSNDNRTGSQVLEVRIDIHFLKNLIISQCDLKIKIRFLVDVWDADSPIRFLRPSDARFCESAVSRSGQSSQRWRSRNVCAERSVSIRPVQQSLAQYQHVHVQRVGCHQAGKYLSNDFESHVPDAH